jgi:FkbM family methyltransferase
VLSTNTGKWESDAKIVGRALRLTCKGHDLPSEGHFDKTPGHFDFVEIGTSDFSTMLQAAADDVIGLSVEPLSDYLNRLPDRTNVKKVNAAISDQDGELPMYFVPEKSITKFGLPQWVRGCNSLGAHHAQVLSLVKDEKLDPAKVFATQMVPVKAFTTLVKEQNIRSIQQLKVDTEGYDGVIMRSYVSACRQSPGLFAPLIRFENPDAVTSADVVCKTDTNGSPTDDCEAVSASLISAPLISASLPPPE